MSNKKQYQQLLDTMNQWLTTATQPSQYENDLSGYQSNLRNWLSSGDYKNPQAVGSIVNMTPVAQQYDTMQYGQNSPSDTVAAGAMNPHYAASQKELGNSAFNNLWSGMYENNAANLRDQSSNIQNTLSGLYANRMNTGLQGSSNILNAYNSKPKGFSLSSVIGPAVSAAEAFI